MQHATECAASHPQPASGEFDAQSQVCPAVAVRRTACDSDYRRCELTGFQRHNRARHRPGRSSTCCAAGSRGSLEASLKRCSWACLPPPIVPMGSCRCGLGRAAACGWAVPLRDCMGRSWPGRFGEGPCIRPELAAEHGAAIHSGQQGRVPARSHAMRWGAAAGAAAGGRNALLGRRPRAAAGRAGPAAAWPGAAAGRADARRAAAHVPRPWRCFGVEPGLGRRVGPDARAVPRGANAVGERGGPAARASGSGCGARPPRWHRRRGSGTARMVWASAARCTAAAWCASS